MNCTHVARKQVGVLRRVESFAEKVAQVSQTDKDEVAAISGQDDVIRRLVLHRKSYVLAIVLGCIPVLFVRAVAELRVHSGEDLL